MIAVAIRGLRKRYGRRVILDDLDLDVGAGEVFALLGPNGAGKTTTVEILEGYRDRDAGEVTVLGTDPARSTRTWRSRIGIVPQNSGTALAELTVAETVSHFAEFYTRHLQPDAAIELVGLTAQRKTLVAELSGGQRRRLDLALGIVGDPELLFLDEPTTGLDPAARQQAWQLVRDLRSLGKTVLLTTHYMDEADALADRVGVIADGRLLSVSAPRELGGRAHAAARVSFRCLPPLESESMPSLPGILIRNDDGLTVVLTDAPGRVTATLSDWAKGQGIAELAELSVTRPTLEDAYFQMLDEASATQNAEM
jgi:ABC-2 type transport system ATP-binding protein